MRKIELYFLLIIFFSSCDKKTSIEDSYQVIDASNVSKDIFDWTDLMCIRKIIPLEITEHSLLGVAQKCLVKNNRILFLDYKMKCIYLFDLDGYYLFTIDSQGGGSEEYIELKDAIFSYDGKEIFVLDHSAILVYDSADGHFLERRNLNADFSSNFHKFVNVVDDSFYFFADSGKYTIYQYINGKLSGVRESKSYQLVYERFHCQNDNHCLLAPDYGFFNVDEITEKGILPKYYIDFGDKSMPESMLPQNSREFDRVDQGTYFKSIVEIKETNQGLYIQAIDPESKYYNIYVDKKTNKLISGPTDRETNLTLVDTNSSSFYALIYPDYFSEKSKLYSKMKDYIVEDGNPILIEFSIKDTVQ